MDDLQRLANRGNNLLAAAVLGLGGLLFGFVVFQEQDLADKVDDGGFLLVAIACVAWYLWRANRFRRSVAPLVFAAVDMLFQLAGLVLERDDPRAFGDNIGGILYFGSATLLIAVQLQRSRSLVETFIGG